MSLWGRFSRINYSIGTVRVMVSDKGGTITVQEFKQNLESEDWLDVVHAALGMVVGL